MSGERPHDLKVFISYSWSGPDHEAWVVRFAEELAIQDVHVILDKWDLRPGHDANAFMESMVTDQSVTKVILVCDQKYVEKSNSRAGGAGTEAQIITPELYAKKDQNKFVAVVMQRDEQEKPYLPVYYGSRIYIDLSDSSSYGTEFDRLLRWIYDKPLYVRPERGTKPAFLSSSATTPKIASSVDFRRACDALRGHQPNALPLLHEYLSNISQGMKAFRIRMADGDRNTFDDRVVASIEEFRPYRNELVEVFSIVAQYACTDETIRAIHRFFEQICPYMARPEHINSYNEEDFDNYRFIVHELFLYAVAVMLKNEKFQAAQALIENEYYWEDTNLRNENMHSYREFRQNIESLSRRNRRLELRRLSLRSDMLHDHNKSSGVDFKQIMAADFILYLRSIGDNIWTMWWPETLLYSDRTPAAFEMFARAKSQRYFDKIKGLIGAEDKDQFSNHIANIKSNRDLIPRWEHRGIDPMRLAGISEIATTN